jgi:peptide/nickel transport system permease protein
VVKAFFRSPGGVLALVVLAFLLGVALLGPHFGGPRANELDFAALNQNPSGDHLFGTDQLGRDIFSRLLVATRLSLSLAMSAAGIGAAIGIPIGAGAAALPPRLRTVALRMIDALLAFPNILVAIFVGAIIGPGAKGALIGVALAVSISFARVSSALSLAISGREFIAAARVAGIRRFRMIFRYILPNIGETLVITATVSISSSIVAVSTLSFLGLGVQTPQFDWGRMLTEGVQSLYLTPLAALAPATAIAVTSLAFGFTGEALARAMNPVLWTGGGKKKAAVVPAGELVASYEPARRRRAAAQAAGDDVVLVVEDLTVEFPGPAGFHPVVDGVSFRLRKAEKLGIVGESGSGKTTTALAIAQLIPHPGRVVGKISLRGQDLSTVSGAKLNDLLGTDLAIVYQDPLSSLNPALKLGTQLTEATQVHRGTPRARAKAMAADRLRDVEIPTPEAQLTKHPHELSGGMRQRAMIAMGLMTDPVLLIADEPTTALDVTVQSQIMDVLHRISADHEAAVILVSHNLGLISQNCDRVLVMYAGRVVEELPAADLHTRARHPYTRALLAAVPDMIRPRDQQLAYIPGQAPDPGNLPPGCPFHARCGLATERCRSERPPLELQADGSSVACWVTAEVLV